jgi:multiple sugar transport system substrate-binding protein
MNGSKVSLSSFTKRLYTGTIIGAALFAGAVSAHAQTVVKVAYSADYFMSAPTFATAWFTMVNQGLKKDMPGATLQLEPIHGG